MPKSILSLPLFLLCCASAAGITLSNTTISTGVSNGTGLAIAPDGRVFVLQQTGQVRIIENGILVGSPALNLPAMDTSFSFSGERGLVGIALDPSFGTNGFVYLHYMREYPGGYFGNRIARYTFDSMTNTINPASLQTLIDLETLNCGNCGGHVGGGMVFGSDGKLYVGVGDRNTPSSAQNHGDSWGSILRLNPNGTFSNLDVIPTDNPFCQTNAPQCAVYAQGLRNPFGVAVQPGTGLIFINDAGENNWEEINALASQANYGWPGCEGPCSPTDPSKTDPVFSYNSLNNGPLNPEGNCAITGGAFFNPMDANVAGAFFGNYLYVDFCSGKLKALNFSGSPTTTTLYAFQGRGPTDIELDVNSGRLYYVNANGTVGYLTNTAVPEPSTWLTAAAALAAVALRTRRRKSIE
jgi:glucose/arabinose dehydrogenase